MHRSDFDQASVLTIDPAPVRTGGGVAIYFGLMPVLTLGALDQGIVATALPSITTQFGRMTDLSLIVAAYAIFGTASMPIYGRLSDRVGAKYMILAAILLFAIGSLVSATSTTFSALLVGRAIQGAGSGGFLPLAQSVVADLIPPRERSRYQGWFTSVYTASGILGPALGGAIISFAPWHYLFYINLPIAAASFALLSRNLTRPRETSASRHFDYAGSFLLIAVAPMVILLTQGEYHLIELGALKFVLIIGLCLASVFLIMRSMRSENPILPFRLFSNKTLFAGCAIMAFTFAGLIGLNMMLPLTFQMVLHLKPAQSGLAMIPLMTMMLIATIINGRIVTRTGRYKRLQFIGLGLITAGAALLMTCLLAHWSPAVLLIEMSLACIGFGLGFLQPNVTVAVQNQAAIGEVGAFTGMLAFIRSLGAAVGVSASGYLFSAIIASDGTSQSRVVGAVSFTGVVPDAATLADAVGRVVRLELCFILLAWPALAFFPELPLRRTLHSKG